MEPHESIILAGMIGAGLTDRLIQTYEEVLTERFSISFLGQARRLARFVLDEDMCRQICLNNGDKILAEPVGPGGLFGALWRLGERLDSGLVTGFDRIPIRQEFIEICNALEANPYTEDDAGSMLLTACDAGPVVRSLQEAGIPAHVIGEITENKARVVMRGETRCYINKDVREPSGEE